MSDKVRNLCISLCIGMALVLKFFDAISDSTPSTTHTNKLVIILLVSSFLIYIFSKYLPKSRVNPEKTEISFSLLIACTLGILISCYVLGGLYLYFSAN